MKTILDFKPSFEFILVKRNSENFFHCIRLPGTNSVPCCELEFMEAFKSKLKLKKGDKRLVCICRSGTTDHIGIAIWHPKDTQNYDFNPHQAEKIALGRLRKELEKAGILKPRRHEHEYEPIGEPFPAKGTEYQRFKCSICGNQKKRKVENNE